MSYRELLIGCGNSRDKRIMPYTIIRSSHPVASHPETEWCNLTTLDVDPGCNPDIKWDLENLPYDFVDDNTYNEIHAYEVLEHCGRQGDFKFFFEQFGELWRILKPGGYLCATVPDYRSQWAFGDPGHTRVINGGSLVFLDQLEYARQVGKTAMSDYRRLLGATNFKTDYAHTMRDTFTFVLQAIK